MKEVSYIEVIVIVGDSANDTRATYSQEAYMVVPPMNGEQMQEHLHDLMWSLFNIVAESIQQQLLGDQKP